MCILFWGCFFFLLLCKFKSSFVNGQDPIDPWSQCIVCFCAFVCVSIVTCRLWDVGGDRKRESFTISNLDVWHVKWYINISIWRIPLLRMALWFVRLTHVESHHHQWDSRRRFLHKWMFQVTFDAYHILYTPAHIEDNARKIPSSQIHTIASSDIISAIRLLSIVSVYTISWLHVINAPWNWYS